MTNRKQKANARSSDLFDTDLITDKHDEIMIWLDANISDLFRGKTIKEKVWEYPILRGDMRYRTIVGYIDMLVKTEEIVYPTKQELLNYLNNSHGYRQYDDVPTAGVVEKNYAIEVKSKIINVGEVIRQINQYKSYRDDFQYIVVAPDERYRDIFLAQKIGFIKVNF